MNIIQIGTDKFPVATLAEAIGCWENARDQNGWGASESPRCTAVINGQHIKISYNGRAWGSDGEEIA